MVPLSGFDPAGHSGPPGQAGGVRLPLRQAIGDGVAGRPGGRSRLRQASRRRHAGLEGRGPAHQGAADRPMHSMNKVFADLPVTIFEAMSQLARDNNAINLGQGFPDDPGPEDIRRAAADAVMDGYNQYPSMMGIPELRQAIATHYAHWHDLDARSDDRSDGHVGRHRGADQRDTGGCRAGRRSGGVPAGVRFLPADHPPGRRHSAPGASGAAALAADGRGAARRLHPQDQGRPVQQSAQSGGGGLSARGPRTAGAVLPGVRHRSRSATRSGST